MKPKARSFWVIRALVRGRLRFAGNGAWVVDSESAVRFRSRHDALIRIASLWAKHTVPFSDVEPCRMVEVDAAEELQVKS